MNTKLIFNKQNNAANNLHQNFPSKQAIGTTNWPFGQQTDHWDFQTFITMYNVLRTPNVTQFKTMLEIYKSILGLCPSRFRWRPWINTEIKSLHFTYTRINLSINGIYIVDMCSEYFSIFQYLANKCVPIGNWGICMFQ